MSKLFAISDLHLSFGTDKPMDVFRGWENHTERLRANWNRLVTNEDTVVIIGDISWAIDLNTAFKDFEFIHSLNGKKIIIKGNHDYWWSTANKINTFLRENEFTDIAILHNNCHGSGGIAVCGTRGWGYDCPASEEKIILRECGRLETSINAALSENLKPTVFLHYPPAYGDYVCEPIMEVLEKYGVEQIYYGHIHGSGLNNSLSECRGIKMKLVSCDCIDFTPFYVCEY